MLDQYTSKRIVLSLRTRSRRVALRGAQQISTQLENHWSAIRVDLITKKLARQTTNQKLDPAFEGCGYDLFDAKENYLKLKGQGKGHIFQRTTERNIDYIVEAIGNRDLSDYSTIDGAKFRDTLIERGLSISSVKRVFSSVRSILNLMIKEHGLQATNPFSGVYMPEDTTTEKRSSIPSDTIIKVQNLCRDQNDELRWLIALISDTGMRLGEAVGLKVSDIVLDTGTPNVHIRPNQARRLKTESSNRVIPLVGEALWGATMALQATGTEYLFPRYTKEEKANANSASAALNKWLREHVPNGCVIHSFRHSMRDRLRAIECPRDIVDQIGGWSVGSIGEGYGIGYPLSVLSKWMNGIN
ncbi:MAG: tyrosine-type recombinase/integrase [Gammaproteobacteria bacterium]|nr:tyrosine-type recombinase/integrase [Gammaproteobacteria bacterium]